MDSNLFRGWRYPTFQQPGPGEGGVLSGKFGGGVRPASQNPYPIYDQNLRYSLPYL